MLRTRIFYIILITCAILGGYVGLASKALATGGPCANGGATYNITYNNTWFWNNWNGTQVAGNNVNYNNVHNDGYNDWCVNDLGTVNDSGEFPFPDGSGLNARYNGRPIYSFTWANAQSWVAEYAQYDQLIGNGRTIINTDVDQSITEIVQSSSDYLVPVWANTLEYAYSGTADLPVLIGTKGNGAIGQGGGVWMNYKGAGLQFNIGIGEICDIHC